MTVRLTGAFIALTTALALSLPGAAHARPDTGADLLDPAPPGTVKITVVKAHGSGCKKSAETHISPDKTAFTVVYSEYRAEVGVGAGHKDDSKECKLSLKLDVPKGYTFAIDQSIHRGFAALEAGATGVLHANFDFQGPTETPQVEHRFPGPYDTDWQRNGHAAGTVFAPCKKTKHLYIKTALKVDAGTSDPKTTTSWLAVDSSDGSVKPEAYYRFAWKKC